MSLLSNFANSAFTTASAVIGTRTFTIDGGTAVAAVPNEATTSKPFEGGGFAPEADLTLVCRKSVFVAAYTSASNTYVNKTVSFNGAPYRLNSIEVGESHVSLILEDEQNA